MAGNSSSGISGLPTAIKKVRGTHRPHRDTGVEPMPSTVGIKKPSGLSVRASACWNEIVPKLKAAGVMTVIDTHALAQYCELYVIWMAAIENIDSKGAVVETERGPVRSPWFDTAMKTMAQMQKLLTEFGMTPASRPKIVSTIKEETKSEWDELH